MCCLIQNLSHAFLILDANTLYKMLIIKKNANSSKISYTI